MQEKNLEKFEQNREYKHCLFIFISLWFLQMSSGRSEPNLNIFSNN
ncbi:unnamed protein product, partial [Brassica rapa]